MTGFSDEQVDKVALTTSADVVAVRKLVRDRAAVVGLDLVSQTKLVTAASELARNTLIYGRDGEMTMDVVTDASLPVARTGLRLVFEDHGPGIEDLDQAMAEGWTSGSGLGLGLPGSQRLVHEFDIRSVPGQGTRVSVVVWRREM